jgi:hypothetical protein
MLDCHEPTNRRDERRHGIELRVQCIAQCTSGALLVRRTKEAAHVVA